jgi:hypothetical protein
MGIKRLSKKRAAQALSFALERAEFVAEIGICMSPACKSGRYLCCHEMVKGTAGRPLAFSLRYCWLVLCAECNEGDFNDYSKFPPERQLALKWIHDRENFQLEDVNRLRGRAPQAITMAQIIPWICRELDWRVDYDRA